MNIANVKTLLKNYSNKMLPSEACGILLGKNDDVEIFYPVVNLKQSASAFEISAESMLVAHMKAESIGLRIIGIFHSHPNTDTILSTIDKKYQAANPMPWIIFNPRFAPFGQFNIDVVFASFCLV